MTISFVGFSTGISYPEIPVAGDLLIFAIDAFGWNPETDSISVDGYTLGGTLDGANFNDFSGDFAEHLEWWYRIATGSDGTGPDATITASGDAVSRVAVVRCADPAEVLANLEIQTPAGGVYFHGVDPPITFQPQGTRATASGIFVGFIFSQVGGRITPDPDTWPCLGLSSPDYGAQGWCSGVLAGPDTIEDAPVAWVQDLAPLTNIYARVTWLTFWINDAGLDCGASPTADCSYEAVGESTAGVFAAESTRTGFCSIAPAQYAVLAADGDTITWTVTLTSGEAAILNTIAGGAGLYFRGFILTADQYDETVVTSAPQLAININGTGDTGSTLALPNFPATDPPDPSQWQLGYTPFGGDWVAGSNTFVVTLVTASEPYSIGPDDFVSTLSVYLDLVMLAICTPVEVDGCPTCDCSEGSSFELCVPVRDFPTAGTGTISGRPPLLCAVYEIAILDRRTQATVVRLPARGHTLDYGYRSGVTSNASLVIDYGALSHGTVLEQECCARLGRVGEWMHELVVRREGNPEEVWGGPINGVQDDPDAGTLTLIALDRSAWWWRRFLPYDLVYRGDRQDAARVFVDLLRAADQPQSYLGVPNFGGQLLPHDPVGLVAHTYPTGVMVDAKVLLKSDDVIIGDEIASLTSAVMEWTVIGRRLYAGALVVNLAPLPLLKQEHWVEHDPVIARNGDGVATKVVVHGAGTVRGEYPPGQVVTPRWPQYGSHAKKVSDSTITDVGVATERARREWERWQQPNFQVLTDHGTLGPRSPITVEDLVPGRAMQVAITEGCMPTSLRLAEQRVGGRIQYYAYDSGQVQPLIVAQRLLETNVRVVDSVEDEVKISTQALGTEVRSR